MTTHEDPIEPWKIAIGAIILIVFIASMYFVGKSIREKQREPQIQSMEFNSTVTALQISPIVKDTAGFNIRQYCIDFMTDINYDSLVSQFKFHETPGVRFVPVKVCYPENNCTEYTFEEFKKWVNQIEQR